MQPRPHLRTAVLTKENYCQEDKVPKSSLIVSKEGVVAEINPCEAVVTVSTVIMVAIIL